MQHICKQRRKFIMTYVNSSNKVLSMAQRRCNYSRTCASEYLLFMEYLLFIQNNMLQKMMNVLLAIPLQFCPLMEEQTSSWLDI